MDEQQQQKLKRSLKSRHVTMIAIGGGCNRYWTISWFREGDSTSRTSDYSFVPHRRYLLLLYDACVGGINPR